MSRFARLTLLTLLAAGAAPATNPADKPTVDALIDRLAAPDAAERKRAFDQLQQMQARFPEVSRRLRIAYHDPRPAVAEAAAQLLLQRGWYLAGDGQPVIKAITKSRYALQPAEGRAAVLQALLAERVPGASKVVVRIASQDPSDEVAWGLVEADDLDPDAVAAGLALDPADRPPGLSAALAKSLVTRGDPAALPLIREALRQDHDRPAASPAQIAIAVRVLADAESRSGEAATAMAAIRKMLVAPLEPADRTVLIDRLLTQHAARGPLPGIAGDLKLADAESEPHTNFALAEMARRGGMPAAAGGLFDAALNGGDESEADRAVRLSDAAEFLNAAGARDFACRTLEAITAVDTAATRGRVAVAYKRLSGLHDLAGRYALAGDALQRAIDHQDGAQFARNGRIDPWTIEDEQGHVYYYYLLDAAGRGDKAAVTAQAKRIVASGSTDGDLFLNAQAYVEAAVPADEVDAYFDRAYAAGKKRIADFPGVPVAFNDLAWLCARSGRRAAEAVSLVEQAVRDAPDEPAFLDTLAEAKFRTGHAKEAVELERRAIAKAAVADEGFMRRQLRRFEAAATTRP